MRCPSCGADNAPGAASCRSCGSDLETSLADLASEPEQVCPSCGEPNTPRARFCVQCGTALASTAAAAAPAASADDAGDPGLHPDDAPTAVTPASWSDDAPTDITPASWSDDAPTVVTPASRPDAPPPRIDADLPEAEISGVDDDSNVGMAVAGAVVAVLVVVVALVGWSVFGRGGDDGSALRSFELPEATVSTTLPATTVAPDAVVPTAPPTTGAPATVAPPATATDTTVAATTPATQPPTTTVPPPTSPPTTPPTTVAPTTAPPSTVTPGGVPGDLDIAGHAMSRPPCDGGYITIVGSATGPNVTGEAVGAVLDEYPDSEYLRTDQTCPSLRQSIDGNPVYVVFFGPYSVPENACAERSRGPADSYVRSLSTDLGPDHTVECPA